MDFAEFFTRHTQEIVPIAWRKGLLFLFDYRGPFIHVNASEQAMHDGIDRLSRAALELLDDGFIFFAAQADWNESGLADIAISIAGTGHRASDARVSELLERLRLTERAHDDGTPEGARVASGVCPFTGATVSFAANRSEGILLAFDITAPASLLEAGPPSDAEGARAWLVSDKPGMYQSLVRRLQRLGWATSTFNSPAQALQRLRTLSPGMARPSLVVATQTPQITASSLEPLRFALPQRTRIMLATAGDTDPLPSHAGSGIEQRLWPFSPAELMHITQQVHETIEQGSGETMPAPLMFVDRPHALVVDDNVVNQLVASGLLQLAGFEVRSAISGEEAIAKCRAAAPQLVLMDVHMPGLDGLQTTRRLRQMQREALLPQFVIVGASADGVGIARAECLDAGMDGYLSKPLSLQAIELEIDRLLPGLRRSVAAH